MRFCILHTLKVNAQAVAFTACAFICVQAQAQSDLLELDLEQLMQIPVTGSTLTNESIKTVPAAVTVFSHDDIQRLGVDYLYELVNFAPGYQFDRHGDSPVGYTFSARGRRNGAQAREVLLLVDGREFTSPRNGGADTTLPLFPLSLIERVEIIRGPGSALHGSSAFVGVINIVTRKAENSVELNVGTQHKTGMSGLISKKSGDWNSNLYVHLLRDEGDTYKVRDSFTQEPMTTDDPYTAVNLDGSAAWKNTTLRFSYHNIVADNFYSIEHVQNGFNQSESIFKQISIEHRIEWSDSVKTDFQLGYLKAIQNLNTVLVGEGSLTGLSTPESSDPLLVKGRIEGDKVRATLITQWTINSTSSALMGIESSRERETLARAYQNYNLDQLINNDFPVEYYGDFSHFTNVGRLDAYNSVGIYGQYLSDITDATHLTLGVRVDRYGDLSDHASPRIGLVHDVNEKNTIKVLYGESYRAPSLGETGLINNSTIIGNPELTYEIAKTWDAIWLLHWSKMTSSFGLFRSDYNQPIIAGFKEGVRTFINGDDEYSQGIEWELQQSFSDHWSSRVSYTYFQHLPDSAFREADHLASVQLNFNQGAWNWNIASFYQSDRVTLGAGNQRETLDSFAIVNSKLRFSINNDMHLNVQIKNITNKEYATPTQGAGITEGIAGRGRETSIGWEWEF